MKQILIIVMLGLGLGLFARKTIFYNRAEEEVPTLDSAYRYVVKMKDTVRVYLRDGALVYEVYSKKINKKRYFTVKAWHPDGTLKYEILSRKWTKEYTTTTYWRNGKVRFVEYGGYKRLDKDKCKAYTESGEDTIYVETLSEPIFPGGKKQENYIHNHNKIWNSSVKNDYIALKFFVEKDGTVSNVRVKNGINPELDNEAIRLISDSAKWTPARIHGDTVRALVEYIFITTVTSSEICKDTGYRIGINKLIFFDYED